jgi:hypothetical protein
LIDKQIEQNHPDDEDGNGSEEQSEDENLNEALYDRLMESINQVWTNFELNEGVIDNYNFNSIMVKIA